MVLRYATKIERRLREAEWSTILFSRKLKSISLPVDLFIKNWNGEKVRLLGVTAFDVIEKEAAHKQLDLFSYEIDAEKEPLYKANGKVAK